MYAGEFARDVEAAAARTLTPRKDDPYLRGYYVGNEPAWPGREDELVEMILAGPATATQREAKRFLSGNDTPERRKAFVLGTFEEYPALINAATRKHAPNHLNLGLRFGGRPPDEVVRMARVFDVYSLNVYDYGPSAQMQRAYELAGRPILIGEFHNGVPGNGLGASLVQVRDQKERGVGYRYYVEQAAALPAFVGANWFLAVDQSVTGRMDGENYNFGFVDVTDRPCREIVEAAKETHRRLFQVHSGKTAPFSQKPRPQ